VEQTLQLTGDIDRLLAVERPALSGGGDAFIRIIGLGLAGRRDEARQLLLDSRSISRIPAFRSWSDTLMAWLERRPAEMLDIVSAVGSLKIMDDPEAIFQGGWLLCDVGEHEQGLGYLQRAVAKGYCVATTLAEAPAFLALRRDPAFQTLLSEAVAGRQQALAAFREAGGERLLGR
jgi:hypothetical protein